MNQAETTSAPRAPQQPSHQSKKSRLFYALVILAVIGGAAFLSYLLLANAPEAERKPQQRQARLVEVVHVKPTTERVSIEAFGQVIASQKIELTAQVSGTVRSVNPSFVPGQAVAKDDVLLEIDASDYQLALDNARANLTSAKADLALEKGNQNVAEGDFSLLGIEANDAEKALILRKPQLAAAEAKVQSAEIAVERAKLDMRRTTIRAPFNAIIISRNIGVGAQVGGSSTSLGELAAAEPYWVELLLSLDALPWITLPTSDGSGGSLVSIKDTANHASAVWQGKVIQLLPSIESEGRRAKVLVEVNPIGSNANGQRQQLLINSYVSAKITGREIENVYRLKSKWIQSNSIWAVRDNKLVHLTIQPISKTGDEVLARAALQADDRIVSSLLSGAVDGMKVRTSDDQPKNTAPKKAKAATAERS